MCLLSCGKVTSPATANKTDRRTESRTPALRGVGARRAGSTSPKNRCGQWSEGKSVEGQSGRLADRRVSRHACDRHDQAKAQQIAARIDYLVDHLIVFLDQLNGKSRLCTQSQLLDPWLPVHKLDVRIRQVLRTVNLDDRLTPFEGRQNVSTIATPILDGRSRTRS
jgi:hypothetical protein